MNLKSWGRELLHFKVSFVQKILIVMSQKVVEGVVYVTGIMQEAIDWAKKASKVVVLCLKVRGQFVNSG